MDDKHRNKGELIDLGGVGYPTPGSDKLPLNQIKGLTVSGVGIKIH